MGGTHSYGPSIFTPLYPETLDLLASAVEIVGLGHFNADSMAKYSRSTLVSRGGISLPFSQTITLALLRSQSITLLSDAMAEARLAASHNSGYCQAPQHIQPVITSIPYLSQRA